MGTKLYLFEKLDFFFFHRYFLRVFLTFSRGLFFTRTISQFFQWLDFSTGKKMIKVVAVAEVGDNFLSRSPTSAAGCFEFCRGRRSRRQKSVAVADFGRRLFFNSSRSLKWATKICRGRRLRPPVIFKFIAVAEVGDKILSRSSTSVSIGAVRGMVGGI